jgi:hypothetical protein
MKTIWSFVFHPLIVDFLEGFAVFFLIGAQTPARA